MDDDRVKTSEVEAAFSLGLCASRPVFAAEDCKTPYAVVPEGAALKSLERFLPVPSRIRQTLSFFEAASFVAYVKAFKDEASRIFADIDKATFLAILDYHGGGQAGTPIARWGTHRAWLTCKLTLEWQRWIAANGKKMDQTSFAAFLEDNLVDVAEPSGATILHIATNLDVKKAVTFASGVRLADGRTQFVYHEDIQGAAEKGTLEIPERFVLGIAAYQGGEKYRLEARLRYRINEGRVVLWFDLYRPEDVLRDAFNQVRALVEKETEIGTLIGACLDAKVEE